MHTCIRAAYGRNASVMTIEWASTRPPQKFSDHFQSLRQCCPQLSTSLTGYNRDVLVQIVR